MSSKTVEDVKVYVAKTWKRNHRKGTMFTYKYHKSRKCALSCVNNGRKGRGCDPIPQSEWKTKLEFFYMKYYENKGLIPCAKCCAKRFPENRAKYETKQAPQ
jgi:hypothetical protein